MSSLDSLRCISYNCRGWNNGSLLVRDLLKSCDLCLIQEHWLFDEQLFNLNIDSEFLSVGVSGMDSSAFLLGRPYGGCAILFRKSLINRIKMLNSHSKRFCAVKLEDSIGSVILLINVYLPTDYSTSVSFGDYLIALGELEGFIDSQCYDHLLIAGDFNVDFDRGGSNEQLLQHFMSNYNVSSIDLTFRQSVLYTYQRDSSSITSWLDHILCDPPTAVRVSNVKRLDVSSNLSDHSPLEFSLAFLCANVPPLDSCQSHAPRCDWARASPSELTCYRVAVSNYLPTLSEDVTSCCNPSCSLHHAALDSCCNQLLDCVDRCAKSCIPCSSSPRHLIAGWNDTARAYKDKANFWHRVWLEAGSPSSGVLCQIKKNSKSRYKYEVRRLKRRQLHIRRKKMASALLSSKSREFWSEVKHVNRSRKKQSPVPSVDGVTGSNNIANLFSSKLDCLLNSQVSSGSGLLHSLSSGVSSDDLSFVKFSTDSVLSSLKHLKPCKSDGSALSSDYFIHAAPVIAPLLASLFTAIVRHGYIPKCLRDCILVPIPKGQKDPSLITTVPLLWRPL